MAKWPISERAEDMAKEPKEKAGIIAAENRRKKPMTLSKRRP